MRGNLLLYSSTKKIKPIEKEDLFIDFDISQGNKSHLNFGLLQLPESYSSTDVSRLELGYIHVYKSYELILIPVLESVKGSIVAHYDMKNLPVYNTPGAFVGQVKQQYHLISHYKGELSDLEEYVKNEYKESKYYKYMLKVNPNREDLVNSENLISLELPSMVVTKNQTLIQVGRLKNGIVLVFYTGTIDTQTSYTEYMPKKKIKDLVMTNLKP